LWRPQYTSFHLSSLSGRRIQLVELSALCPKSGPRCGRNRIKRRHERLDTSLKRKKHRRKRRCGPRRIAAPPRLSALHLLLHIHVNRPILIIEGRGALGPCVEIDRHWSSRSTCGVWPISVDCKDYPRAQGPHRPNRWVFASTLVDRRVDRSLPSFTLLWSALMICPLRCDLDTICVCRREGCAY
jgi:hypothetical protein